MIIIAESTMKGYRYYGMPAVMGHYLPHQFTETVKWLPALITESFRTIASPCDEREREREKLELYFLNVVNWIQSPSL